MTENQIHFSVRTATPGDADAWNDFLNTATDANFYQRFEWLESNATALQLNTHPLIVEGDRGISGVLPLVRVESWLFGRILSSMPFVNFGGPVASTAGAEALLLSAAKAAAARYDCDYLEIRATRPLDGFLHSLDKVSMTIRLSEDPEELHSRFSRAHRKNLRAALKNSIDVRHGGIEFLDDFYSVLAISWHALGTPFYRKSYFDNLITKFGSMVRVFVAYHDSKPIAAAMVGMFSGTVEGMWIGTLPQYHRLQASYVLYWEMIRWACLEKYSFFHLGRSTKDSGAIEYKRKWLAEPKQLYWNYHLVHRETMPGLNPRNPKYALAINIWRHLPRVLVDATGPSIARLIP